MEAANIKSCSCSCPSPSRIPRTSKRKLDQTEEDNLARIATETEALALRAALSSQHQSIQTLHSDLEAERAAASSAASEAMSMILRLQREKAEAQMDARQFKRLAQEKMRHDQQQIALLRDLICEREEAARSLSCQLQAYYRADTMHTSVVVEKGAIRKRRVVKKTKACFVRSFSVVSVVEWVASLFFWIKKSPRIKYPLGLSNQKTGLLVLLDKSQRKRLKRCLTRLPR